ncbi:hypothetical protein [Mesorhizobium abyssinicae]|uniref:hypothetical protein n=1 Tax=Mesorhizobium abyssinicae TaxID=1209958 RepID=UPI0033947199
MAKHVKTIGTGITTESHVTYSGEDMMPAMKRWTETWNAARKEGGGDYGAVTLELVKQSQNILSGAGERPFLDHSQEWFAEQILIHHKIVKNAVAKQDADTAARFAYQMGFLHCQAHMKAKWEPSALTGQKVRHESPGADKGGRKIGKNISRDVSMAKEFQERRKSSRRSATALKEEIGRAYGLGRSASIEAINCGLKKLSG